MARRALLQRLLLSVTFAACAVLSACGPGRFKMEIENPVEVEVDSIYVIVAEEELLADAKKPETAREVIREVKLKECLAYEQFRNSPESPGTWVSVTRDDHRPTSITIGLSKDGREILLSVHRSLLDIYPKLAAAAVIDYRDGKKATRYFSRNELENTSSAGLRVSEGRFVPIEK